MHELFITHVFEVEQKVYEQEDIQWEVQDYQDNKNIINTILRKPDGIFALIEDASKQPGDDDIKKDREILLPSMDKQYQDCYYDEVKNPRGVYRRRSALIRS